MSITPVASSRPALTIAFALIALALNVSSTVAQTGPSLVIRDWPTEASVVETRHDFMLVTGGYTKGDDHGIKTLYIDNSGRVKFDAVEQTPTFSAGYHALTIDIGGDHPDLPGGATDLAAVGALSLGTAFDDWELTLIGGAGTATTNHFSDGEAIYGIGTLHATRRIDDQTAWHVGLNYNGNRSIFPDIPLPYITYQSQLNDRFGFTLGVPFSGLRWRVFDNVSIELSYGVPTTINGRATLHLSQQLGVFAEYKQTLDGFWIDDVDHRRLFYEAQRAAVGVEWRTGHIDVAAGVGFAFDQEYSVGWDVRDTDEVAEPSDEVLVFLRLGARF